MDGSARRYSHALVFLRGVLVGAILKLRAGTVVE
jgi:hypothetical protein